jgi:transposase-like protein
MVMSPNRSNDLIRVRRVRRSPKMREVEATTGDLRARVVEAIASSATFGEAAKRLGVSRQTLVDWRKKLQIQVDDSFLRHGEPRASLGPRPARPAGAKMARWDEPLFLRALERSDPAAVPIARRILDWAVRRGLRVQWGEGKQVGSFYPMIDHTGATQWTVSVWTDGTLQFPLKDQRSRPPFDGDHRALASFVDRLIKVPGVVLNTQAYPTVRLTDVEEAGGVDQLLGELDQVIDQVRSAPRPPSGLGWGEQK